MGKYVMKEIPENEVVVLDVPVGKMRVGGQIRPDGEEGMMVFSIADNPARPGDKVGDEAKTPAVKIAVHGPGSAFAIAKAFAEMAHEMIDIACDLVDDEEDEEWDDEDAFDDDGDEIIPCGGCCAFCEGCDSDED